MRRLMGLGVVGLLVVPVLAASPAIETRQKLMKSLGLLTKEGSEMVKGFRPFDAERAKAIFEGYVGAARQLPGLFPEDSKEGGYTKVLPEVWTQPADFAAAIKAFGVASEAAVPEAADASRFAAAFAKASGHCKSCHSDYRE